MAVQKHKKRIVRKSKNRGTLRNYFYLKMIPRIAPQKIFQKYIQILEALKSIMVAQKHKKIADFFYIFEHLITQNQTNQDLQLA